MTLDSITSQPLLRCDKAGKQPLPEEDEGKQEATEGLTDAN